VTCAKNIRNGSDLFETDSSVKCAKDMLPGATRHARLGVKKHHIALVLPVGFFLVQLILNFVSVIQHIRGVKLTTHLQLVPRSRKCDSIHPLPHTSSWRSA
jgi:hypothetical protein